MSLPSRPAVRTVYCATLIAVTCLSLACVRNEPVAPSPALVTLPPSQPDPPEHPSVIVREARSTRLPAPMNVCVATDGGIRPGRAEASWAGMYDPNAPIHPEQLNWMVPGVGCVSYPGAATSTATCFDGKTQVPLVRPTLCMQ